MAATRKVLQQQIFLLKAAHMKAVDALVPLRVAMTKQSADYINLSKMFSQAQDDLAKADARYILLQKQSQLVVEKVNAANFMQTETSDKAFDELATLDAMTAPPKAEAAGSGEVQPAAEAVAA